jgi:hypothetical protein
MITILEEIIELIVANRDMSSRAALDRRKRKPNTTIIKHITKIAVTLTEITITHKMWHMQLPVNMRSSRKMTGFVTVEIFGTIETLLKLAQFKIHHPMRYHL